MAQGVVHVLEVVEVQAEHGGRPVRTARPRQRFVQPFAEQHPIRQVGQRVVVRDVVDAPLAQLQLGDVRVEDDRPPVGGAVLVDQEPHVLAQPAFEDVVLRRGRRPGTSSPAGPRRRVRDTAPDSGC